MTSVYEDPDASAPAATDGSQSEVKVKPVPRPRSKFMCNTNNNILDPVDKADNTTIAVDSHPCGYPKDYIRPKPVCPPPRPPRPPMNSYVTFSKPTAGVDGGNHHVRSNTETALKPPADGTERILSPPPLRPKRPPHPPIYHDRLSSTMRPASEIYTDESEQSRPSSFSPDDVGGASSMVTDCADRPAPPPRLVASSLSCSGSVSENLPLQSRPPLPPTPPPSGGQSESVYSEIEYRPYLDILPDDNEDIMTQGGSTLQFGQHNPHGCCSSHQQITPYTEDIIGMLRWLKRVLTESDSMAPSLYGLSIEEEIRSFNQRGRDVSKGLRLYNLLMMKRNEGLRDLITEFFSISNSLDKIKKKTKTMGIAGGTTGAVGGVTAVLGIALAPITMGTSLIATAVGAGMVASAGGISAHTAQQAKKKVVNRMAVEKLVYEYKSNICDLEHCLDFILSGMNELRRHDIPRLQRAGAQTDAVKVAHLSQSVIGNYMNIYRKGSVAHTSGMSSGQLLQAFIKEMDQYFTDNDGQKLKKSSKSRFSGRVRLLAENLQDELDHLNRTWEMFC